MNEIVNLGNGQFVKITMLKGEKGDNIASIVKTSTSGLVDTYTITLTDGSTSTFDVTNGNGIVSIEKTSTSGLVDTYTITFTDGSTTTFTVTNGQSGQSGGMVSKIYITSDAGSTVTVTLPSGTVKTATLETGSSTLWECDTTEYGTHVIDAILNGDDAQMTLTVDACKIYTVDDTHFHASITVTYPSDATCRCQGGGENYYATGSPYTFSVHHATTYTITVSDGVNSRTENVVITTNGQSESLSISLIPEGSTVTPTDDVQTWLNCAGIFDKNYTTVSQVLSDSTTLLALMSDNNAVDYLVRSTTFASDICANSTAMTDINSNTYCVNTLLADNTWLTAICNSTYFETILNVKVPTMTSNTTPSGVCSASNTYAGLGVAPWNAFDGTTTKGWTSETNVSDASVQYQFTSAVNVKKCSFKVIIHTGSAYSNHTFYIEGSNDNSTWTRIGQIDTLASNADATNNVVCNNSNSYTYYRLKLSGTLVTSGHINKIALLQFYGRASS